MSIIKNKKLTSILVISTTLSISNYNVYANNICKGSSETTCSKSDHCRWVKSYKRSDGATVKAYCRTNLKKQKEKLISKKPKSIDTNQ